MTSSHSGLLFWATLYMSKQCCTWTEYVTPAMTISSNLVKYYLSISSFSFTLLYLPLFGE